MPLNHANCGILAVLAQIKDVPADYLPVYFRYVFVMFFCETYEEFKVSHFQFFQNILKITIAIETLYTLNKQN